MLVSIYGARRAPNLNRGGARCGFRDCLESGRLMVKALPGGRAGQSLEFGSVVKN